MAADWDTGESSVRAAAVHGYAAASVVSCGGLVMAAPYLLCPVCRPTVQPWVGYPPVNIERGRPTYVADQHTGHCTRAPAMEPTMNSEDVRLSQRHLGCRHRGSRKSRRYLLPSHGVWDDPVDRGISCRHVNASPPASPSLSAEFVTVAKGLEW